MEKCTFITGIVAMAQIYEEIISDFMRAHPSLTREQAEKAFEGFL
jgi:hypothetical protein